MARGFASAVLASFKVNDQITIRYADELAMALHKADAAPRHESNAISRKGEGGPLRRWGWRLPGDPHSRQIQLEINP